MISEDFESGYGLGSHNDSDNLTVSDVGNWNRELDWLVLACCSTCKINNTSPPSGPGIEWAGTMSNGTHAIMGYKWGAKGEPYDIAIAQEFVDNLNNLIISTAWVGANCNHMVSTPDGVYSPLHCVVIQRGANINDQIDPDLSQQYITPDSTSNVFFYTYLTFSTIPVFPYVDPDSVSVEGFQFSL